MEQNPFGPNSFESSSENSNKKDKEKPAKKKDVERALEPDKKERAREHIGRSLFERSEKEEPEVAERLTDDEKQRAAHDIATEHREAIEEEGNPPELEPAADFLERVQDGQSVEDAFAETAAEQGLEPEEIAELLEESAEPEPESEPANEEAVESEPDDDDDGEMNDGQTIPLGGVGAGSGGTPPPPPRPPRGGSAAAPPPPPGGPVGAPNQAAANTLPPQANTYFVNRHNAADLLAGAVVGYLWGRRRGRIKAEKRLLPVQKKLEKQVKALQEDITYKERQLVAIAAKKTEKAAPVRKERMQPGRQETRLGLEKPVRAERLGHMVVAAEAPVKVVEKIREPGNIRQAFRPEQVKTMDRTRLLELSEKVVVEGATLRKVYETGLIGERQLRHLVSEYLQGHDIRDELRRHMVEHEIDFERDPMLRDRVRARMSETSGGSGGLQKLLKEAGMNEPEEDPQLLRQIEKEQARQADEMAKHKRQRIVSDVAMATAIVVLAVVVIILVGRQ